ncbi:hypothetical protein PHET_02370 [Paragonimus heterotremus]|uniref:C-type lectin domain-containing protein n=1 Tax=Paragonimus heterotremus TaxID=100268 RepID=A0A8J4WU15_9TREM|nr:hypothetical protein PHET_02370 [Paragonimus heterotremus]
MVHDQSTSVQVQLSIQLTRAMRILVLYLGLVLSCVVANPLTSRPTAFTTGRPRSTTKPSILRHGTTGSTWTTATATAVGTATVSGISEPTKHPKLLRDEDEISPVASRRLRGRVILANTRTEGNDEWGVNAEQAELACDRIARYQTTMPHTSSLLRTLMDTLGSMQPRSQPKPMEGHLLSVGSSREVMALSRLLKPVPPGAFWTGGKLTRYRVNSMKENTHTDHIVLTWSDGRVGRPSIFGLSKRDEEQLREGYTYCLALNLQEASWQARDCSDLLPYICLITPRQTGFSNEAIKARETTSRPERSGGIPMGTATMNDMERMTDRMIRRTVTPSLSSNIGATDSMSSRTEGVLLNEPRLTTLTSKPSGSPRSSGILNQFMTTSPSSGPAGTTKSGLLFDTAKTTASFKPSDKPITTSPKSSGTPGPTLLYKGVTTPTSAKSSETSKATLLYDAVTTMTPTKPSEFSGATLLSERITTPLASGISGTTSTTQLKGSSTTASPQMSTTRGSLLAGDVTKTTKVIPVSGMSTASIPSGPHKIDKSGRVTGVGTTKTTILSSDDQDDADDDDDNDDDDQW